MRGERKMVEEELKELKEKPLEEILKELRVCAVVNAEVAKEICDRECLYCNDVIKFADAKGHRVIVSLTEAGAHAIGIELRRDIMEVV